MKEFNLEGIYPALVTPFKNVTDIDEKALRRLVNFVIDEGVTGVVPVGTTGEFIYMSKEERKKTVEIVINEVKGRVPVIAGTGASSTLEAIELTKHAEKTGADAALVVSPYYLRPADKGDFQHYYDLTQATNIPIVLYNIPQCTGAFLSREVVEDLAQIRNVVGLKDSSGNLPYTLELLQTVGNKINIVCGHDEVVLPALAAGAKGAILASANVIPDTWIKLYEAVKEGKINKARELQMNAQKLARIFVRHGGAVAVKAALKMRGLDMGKARRPLVSGGVLSMEVREELRMELEKLKLIKPIPISEISKSSEPLEEEFKDLGITSQDIKRLKLATAEGASGEGIEWVHISLLAGPKNSPVGFGWAKAAANPEPGYEALTAIIEPNLAVKPLTVIVPAVKIESMRQASIIYGPVQSAVGKAVADATEEKIIPEENIETYAIIVKTFVHPAVVNRRLLYMNTYDGVKLALLKAFGLWRKKS